ncbi:PREDICTED: uncharacterized protein LOC106815141 [Priapulus caudatus]|uniref:Uncharacterized protein LOC106815141 n=1 Tax=Priapulus caudatus TaxID=37621 RepID=A0ABM1ES88_PRICU|nr:PREDICTED: uncharacterized protein LOC106815141 [Priapulus caudatus]
MKANPKKLGGRKGDRMTPDWLSGYVIVELSGQKVVLRNESTGHVLKGTSIVHIKPFLMRETAAQPSAQPGTQPVENVQPCPVAESPMDMSDSRQPAETPDLVLLGNVQPCPDGSLPELQENLKGRSLATQSSDHRWSICGETL